MRGGTVTFNTLLLALQGIEASVSFLMVSQSNLSGFWAMAVNPGAVEWAKMRQQDAGWHVLIMSIAVLSRGSRISPNGDTVDYNTSL
jgi:hypothetical protein